MTDQNRRTLIPSSYVFFSGPTPYARRLLEEPSLTAERDRRRGGNQQLAMLRVS